MRNGETGPGSIRGYAKPQFESVRIAFTDNFAQRNELGAACCVYYRGEKVVDLWGGVRNESTLEPWEQDTMVIVFSATKGMAGLAMALAQSRGLFDYDECVSAYWPEFSQQGKDRITVRQLLSHQAGLFAFEELSDRAIIGDPERLADVLARQKPAHPPGERQFYHALTLGYYESELLRRVDPKKRTVGQYFHEEIAAPLGLDFYIRLPEDVPNSRLATIKRVGISLSAILTVPFPLFLASITPRSAVRRSLAGSLFPLDDRKVYARNFEVPAGGGVGTARAIARAYDVFARGGNEVGLKGETLQQLMAPPVPPLKGFRDGALKVVVPFSLGFARPSKGNPFGSPTAFGSPGAGGAFGFADPREEIGYAYTPNRMGTSLIDPRDIALRSAMYAAIDRLR